MVDWCRLKVIQLIHQWRMHPILWEFRIDHSNKNRKNEAIAAIGKAIQVPSDEIKKKIHGLKVQFSREHCRVRREKQRTGRTIIPSWYGYEQLLFLKDGYTRRKKYKVMNDKPYKGDVKANNDITYKDDISARPVSPVKIEIQPTFEDVENIEIEKEEFQVSTQNHSNETNNFPSQHLQNSLTTNDSLEKGGYDDLTSFGIYIASKLKAFNDPYLQTIAKHQINKIIFEIEMDQCQRRAQH